MSLQVVVSKKFKKDLKKVLQVRPSAKNTLQETVDLLIAEKPLPTSRKDHPLKGNLLGFRDCHIQGDLVLIYKVEKKEKILRLVRIGTHSELDF